MKINSHPFARPFYVMLKPAGSRCNLACRYCYYMEKRHFFDETADFCMSDDILERFTQQYIEAQTTPDVLFTWHGGEPLLRPLQFYKKALELQKRYAAGHHIDNCLQTNGTLLNDEWCEFLRDNNFLVGVSIDGPRHLHNILRGNSFDKVMRGIELLDRYNVQWNAMATVNSANVGHPLEFYRFFKSIGCRYIQFTPIVERTDGMVATAIDSNGEDEAEMMRKLSKESISSRQWGNFLCTVFSEWVRRDVGETFVQLFDATLANRVGVTPGICSMAPTCGQATAMEFNGDMFCCDHFVFPEYRLGNIGDRSFTEMMLDKRLRHFGSAKRTSLPRQCRECRWLSLCNGECPKNRLLHDCYGESGLNLLCEGYRRFFQHAAPAMDFMAQELAEGRAPANIINDAAMQKLYI